MLARAISPPPGYVMRRARMEDLVPAAALIALAEAFDTGLGDTTADRLLEEWEAPGFELSQDAWLVFAEGSDQPEPSDPVGYASIETRDQERQLGSGVIVHPEHRGRGVGWYLTDLVAARAAERAALAPPGDHVVLKASLPAQDLAGHRLLEERGFSPVRHFWHMEASLTDDLPPPPPVSGVSLRGFVL